MPEQPEGPQDEGPRTRQEWLTNNANIILGEGGDDDEVFYNEIETRLGFDPEKIEGYTEADERLATAYINSLARYEAEPDGDPTWAPRSVESLVEREGVTAREAGVIAIMAAREYPGKSTEDHTKKRVLIDFFKWLHTNTDTFDIFMVEDAIETAKGKGEKIIGFSEEEQVEMIETFLDPSWK